MPKHLREDGRIAYGYFCNWCGQPCGMVALHENCEANAPLVAKLIEINKFSTFEEYTFSLLKKRYNEETN